MRDQKLEGRQENKPPAGDVPGSAVPVHEPGTPIHTRQHDYTYYKELFSRHTMPFAYLDLDLFDQNIRQVVARAGGKRVRLASKSLRSVSVIRRIFASDPCFQGIMCYTAPEAVYLASQGFDDLLVGYPAWNEQDITAVARAVAAGKGAYVGAERSGAGLGAYVGAERSGADRASGAGDITSGAGGIQITLMVDSPEHVEQIEA